MKNITSAFTLFLLLLISSSAFGAAKHAPAPANADIVCPDITDDGIGSIFETYEFRLNTASKLSACSWSFNVYDKASGAAVCISTAEGSVFSVSLSGNTDKYRCDSSGAVIGLIECQYQLNGETITARPFKVFLEQKPKIHEITDIQKIPVENTRNFIATFKVRYSGAEKLSIGIEREYVNTIEYINIREPFLAHVQTSPITSVFYSWISIKAVNDYGESVEYIEFPPEDPTNSVTTIGTAKHEDLTVSVTAYNLQGALAGNYASERSAAGHLSNGLYILIGHDNEGHETFRKKVYIGQ